MKTVQFIRSGPHLYHTPAFGDFTGEYVRLEDVQPLIEALRWYANPANWGHDDWGVMAVAQPPEYSEPGTIARAALSDLEATHV